MRMSTEHAQAMAHRFEELAAKVRDELDGLHVKAAECKCCHLTVAEDFDEYNLAKHIEAAASRLDKLAGGLRGRARKPTQQRST